MPRPVNSTDAAVMIPHEIMLARLKQSGQIREFFVQMWLRNPALANNAGARIRAMLEPLKALPPAPTFVDVPKHE
jgi:hypothetical protein